MTIVAQARRTRPVVRAEAAALAELPAGPALCAALAGIDITAVGRRAAMMGRSRQTTGLVIHPDPMTPARAGPTTTATAVVPGFPVRPHRTLHAPMSRTSLVYRTPTAT